MTVVVSILLLICIFLGVGAPLMSLILFGLPKKVLNCSVLKFHEQIYSSTIKFKQLRLTKSALKTSFHSEATLTNVICEVVRTFHTCYYGKSRLFNLVCTSRCLRTRELYRYRVSLFLYPIHSLPLYHFTKYTILFWKLQICF